MPPILRGFRVAVPVCVSAAVSFLSLRCRLLDGSHYTRLTNVRQIESTQTTPKPLQTLAFIGVSQPHDGDTKTGTPQPRPRHATARPQSRRDHDGHDGRGHDRSHDVQGTTATDMIAYKGSRPRKYRTTRQNTTEQTFQRCTVQQTPPVGEPPHGTKNKAAGSLVLTPNAAGSKF